MTIGRPYYRPIAAADPSRRVAEGGRCYEQDSSTGDNERVGRMHMGLPLYQSQTFRRCDGVRFSLRLTRSDVHRSRLVHRRLFSVRSQ